MSQGRGRGWTKRLIAVAAAGLVVAVGYGALNWPHLKAAHAARQLRKAATDDQRHLRAGQLIDLGESGQAALVDVFRSDDEAACAAAADALNERFAAIEPGQPEYHGRCRSLIDGFATFSETGQASALDLVPALMKCPEPELATRSVEIVRAGLRHPSPTMKLRALRLGTKAELPVKSDVVQLLNDPDAKVRRSAMLAVGPVVVDEAPVVATEDLFRWLNDEDAQVRDYCESALLTRGLDSVHIGLARFLSHPDPSERLKLLTELQAGASGVKDPGPWLERLSRDPDPAVRLGAARVAFESRLQFAKWVDRLADEDADPTVRKWAGYYRGLSSDVKQTSFEK